LASTKGSPPNDIEHAYALPIASAELSRRVGKVVGYPPLVEMDDRPRREFYEALLDAGAFEALPGKWQAAILEAEENRPRSFRSFRMTSRAEGRPLRRTVAYSRSPTARY
jgi:hypothetical protein